MVISLVLVAVLCWTAGFWILFRIPLCHRSSSSAADTKRVSIIIPARNEAHNLGRLLESIRTQAGRPHETVVVDDNSEDNTAEVARKHGARVVSCPPLPDGWLGKPWACRCGAGEAGGDILLFLDADLFFEPDGLQRLTDVFEKQSGVLSVAPYHVVKKPYETFSGFFNLMQMVGTGVFAFGNKARARGMFGPCVMIGRGLYEEVGGHETVKDRVLEHFALGGVVHRKGAPIELRGGRKSLNTRMYPNGWRELIAGWTKSFTIGARETPSRIMIPVNIWISGINMSIVILILALLFGTTAEIAAASGVYLLYAGQITFQFRRLGTFSPFLSIAYPLPLLVFLGVFFSSSYRRKRRLSAVWKGRKVG